MPVTLDHSIDCSTRDGINEQADLVSRVALAGLRSGVFPEPKGLIGVAVVAHVAQNHDCVGS